MGISPHIARLRHLVGTELLQLPSVAVLPRREDGAVLLVRHADTGLWGLIGGAIELDERPEEAARREAHEESGVHVSLSRILGVFGGPDYRVTYPNGDRASYVVIAFDAEVESGTPTPDGDEVDAVEWFRPAQLSAPELNPLARTLLREVGIG